MEIMSSNSGSSNSGVNLSVILPFPTAGVAFNISVASEDEGALTFSLNVTDLNGGNALPFSVDVSPCLADWVRGYARWLVRAGVRATHDSGGITGTFGESMTAEQVLLGVRDACDMIRQRFELYEESVLV